MALPLEREAYTEPRCPLSPPARAGSQGHSIPRNRVLENWISIWPAGITRAQSDTLSTGWRKPARTAMKKGLFWYSTSLWASTAS